MDLLLRTHTPRLGRTACTPWNGARQHHAPKSLHDFDRGPATQSANFGTPFLTKESGSQAVGKTVTSEGVQRVTLGAENDAHT